MSESNKITSADAENNYQRHYKTRKKGYVVVIEDGEGHLIDTPFASFDKGLAEEIALEYAWEFMWSEWFYDLHCLDLRCSIYNYKLTDYLIFVKEISWHG